VIAVPKSDFLKIEAYLQGALKDGTFSARHRSHRIGQKEREWLVLLRGMLSELGWRGWIYREGRTRDFWVLETGAPFLSTSFDARPLIGREEGIAYVRGFFDAEGGLPRDIRARFYIQFVQKDRPALAVVREILESWEISCGRLHNPSSTVDPDLWRFYVRATSHQRFLRVVGSWHPRKSAVIATRLTVG
jgi:hypothetical protein